MFDKLILTLSIWLKLFVVFNCKKSDIQIVCKCFLIFSDTYAEKQETEVEDETNIEGTETLTTRLQLQFKASLKKPRRNREETMFCM